MGERFGRDSIFMGKRLWQYLESLAALFNMIPRSTSFAAVFMVCVAVESLMEFTCYVSCLSLTLPQVRSLGRKKLVYIRHADQKHRLLSSILSASWFKIAGIQLVLDDHPVRGLAFTLVLRSSSFFVLTFIMLDLALSDAPNL